LKVPFPAPAQPAGRREPSAGRGTKAIHSAATGYNLRMGPGSEVSGASRSGAGPLVRESAYFLRERARLGIWKRAASLLLLLYGSACSSPPEIRPGAPRALHDFDLLEGYRGQIRKIDVWFEPGHVLQWELNRTDDPERNKIPLAGFKYGETPACMDQVFPPGVPERPEEGQITSITLEYGTEGDPDPIVRSILTRWYQKKGRSFAELSEQEAEAEEHSRKANKEERH